MHKGGDGVGNRQRSKELTEIQGIDRIKLSFKGTFGGSLEYCNDGSTTM